MEAKIRWCWGILPIMWISFVYFYLELTSQPASNPFRVNNEKFNSKRGTDYFDNLQSIKLKTGWICFCWILHSFVFDFSIYYFYEKNGQKECVWYNAILFFHLFSKDFPVRLSIYQSDKIIWQWYCQFRQNFENS